MNCAMCGRPTEGLKCPRCFKPLCFKHGTEQDSTDYLGNPRVYIPGEECRVPVGGTDGN